MSYNEAMFNEIVFGGSSNGSQNLSSFFGIRMFRAPPKDLKVPFGVAYIEPTLKITKDNRIYGKAVWYLFMYVGSLKEAQELTDKAKVLTLSDFVSADWKINQMRSKIQQVAEKVYEVQVIYDVLVR